MQSAYYKTPCLGNYPREWAVYCELAAYRTKTPITARVENGRIVLYTETVGNKSPFWRELKSLLNEFGIENHI